MMRTMRGEEEEQEEEEEEEEDEEEELKRQDGRPVTAITMLRQ